MQFEFDAELVTQNSIEIEEIGNFAIEACNAEGYYYYLIVRTSLGTVSVASCGPIIPDVKLLPSGFKITYDKLPYKEDKLGKTINFWLNDKSKHITDAREINIEDAIEEFPDMQEYLNSYSEEIY